VWTSKKKQEYIVVFQVTGLPDADCVENDTFLLSSTRRAVSDPGLLAAQLMGTGCTKYQKMAANVVKHAKLGKKVELF
jgi:hypothetical protein